MPARWFKRILYFLLGIFILLNIMAAFHAYKFTHFYSNIPPVKKPEQMSAGEKISSIFLGINYPKSKVVDSFHIAHDTVLLKTMDGMKLESWYAKADSNARGTVVMFHGHGSCKSGIIKEAEAFHHLGWNVLLTDFRAHGNSEGSVCTIGANEAKDVKAAYEYIQLKGEKNIVLWGISLGAAVILKAVADFELKPSKTILEMPFATLLDGVNGRLRTMHLPEQPFSTLLTFWGGAEQGFWAFNLKPEAYAAKMNCPVLLQWGVKDQRVTAGETNLIFGQLGTSEKQLVKYKESGHESLYKKESLKWLNSVSYFLQ